MRSKMAMHSHRPQNLLSIVLISFFVLILLVVVNVNSVKLREKKESCDKREAYLIEKIEKENKRTLEIEEYGKYIHTKKYVEDIAKERLGLVYKNEIIFEAEN